MKQSALITFIFVVLLFLTSCASTPKVTGPNEAIVTLGQIAKNAIPKDKPGRLRAYLLPVDQDQEQSTKDLTEALLLERGQSGYFAILSYDSESLAVASLKAFPDIEKNYFQKLTIIFVGESQYKDLVRDVISHTGAKFIYRDFKQ